MLARGLAGSATCSRVCDLEVQVALDPKAAKKAKLTESRLATARVVARAGPGAAVRILVRLPKAVRAKLAKAKSLPLTVIVFASSGSESTQQTLRLKLKR